MNDKKIVEQFKKIFFKNGVLCKKYDEKSVKENYMICKFFNYGYDVNWCIFYNERVEKFHRCDQCIKEQGL